MPLRYSPFAYEIHEDPYPVYRRLRGEAPVYRNDELGFWALSRHADVLAAFRDPITFSNAGGVALEQKALGNVEDVLSILGMDPPRHDRVRGLVAKAFTPKRVAALEPYVRDLCRHSIDAFCERGECEFIDEFAGRMPMDVVSEMLGVPSEDRATLRRWSDAVVHREDGVAEVPPAAIEASLQLLRYYADLVARRRKAPRDDLLGGLIAARLDGEALSDREIIAFLYLMGIAGNETTTKLLGNALYWAWKNPEERERVLAHRGAIPGWVEETLRYDPSSQALARTLARDLELHGRTLRKGDKVLLLIGAANRDERVFEDPDRYDLRRDTTWSLAFGRGTHFCLGAALARLEARVALEEVIGRLPGFTLDESRLVRFHSSNVRGFAAMPIAFEPGPPSGGAR